MMPDNRHTPGRNELLDLDDSDLLRHCRQDCFRASGPGGQHRNTTDSAVRLTALDGAVIALCADHRSQHRNRAEALKRLRTALAIELRLPVSADAAAGFAPEAWKLGKKDRRYARFIAHVLDVLACHDWAVGPAARALGISTGKLIRRLAQDPRAWNAVNQARSGLNLINLRHP